MTDPGWESDQQHDPAAERAVLGAILTAAVHGNKGDTIGQMMECLTGAADFYDPRHALIYRKASEMVGAGVLPHPLEIISKLQANELARLENGTYVMSISTEGVPSQGTYYARKVREWAVLRNSRAFSARVTALTHQAAAGDVADLIQQIQDDAAMLESGGSSTSLVDQGKTNDEVVDWIGRAVERKGEPAGALSGWADLDRLLKGLQPGQFVVVAGRPGMGKSTWARNYVYNTAVYQGLPAAFFSLEMSRLEVGLCMMSADSRVPLNVLRDGTLNEEDWARVADMIARSQDAPLFYDETPGTTLAHMESGLRWMRAKYGQIGLVAFDYLQLSPSPGGRGGDNRQAFVGELSRGIKLLAKKYETPIIGVSQLNRGPENRPNKRPQLSDLRESGSIEQDADIVVLLHREDYYDSESERSGEADFIVAKHRNGPTDTITVAAQLHLSRFVSMAIV